MKEIEAVCVDSCNCATDMSEANVMSASPRSSVSWGKDSSAKEMTDSSSKTDGN